MKGGLGQMPLTLFLVVAAIVLFFYLRRAHLGIDTHPGETVTIAPRKGAPPVLPPVGAFHLPTVTLPPDSGGGGSILGPWASDSGGGGSIR